MRYDGDGEVIIVDDDARDAPGDDSVEGAVADEVVADARRAEPSGRAGAEWKVIGNYHAVH